MSVELALAESVAAWVEKSLPGEPGLAEHAAGIALNRYEWGASVSEAAREAREYVESWTHHPAQGGIVRELAPVVKPACKRVRHGRCA